MRADPNYGTLSSGDSTWFWKEYGDTFQEYLTTSSVHTYRMTFVITPKAGFDTVRVPLARVENCNAPDIQLPTADTYANDTALPNWVQNVGAAQDSVYHYSAADVPYTYIYTVQENDGYCGETAILPFVSTRQSVDVELHVIRVNVNTGALEHMHDWLRQENGADVDHSVTLSLGAAPTAFPDPLQFFAGWEPAVTAVTGDATYQAKFTAEKRTWAITFKDHDGTVIHTQQVAYGGCGGAVYAVSSAFSMTGGTLSGNTADWHGGAVFAENGSVNARNVAISGNSATNGNGDDNRRRWRCGYLPL